MTKIAPSQTSNGDYDVRRCLKACNKMKVDQEVCRQLCFRQFWKGVFTDITQVAQENDTPQSVWMEALTTEFEAKFGTVLIIEHRPKVTVNGG